MNHESEAQTLWTHYIWRCWWKCRTAVRYSMLRGLLKYNGGFLRSLRSFQCRFILEREAHVNDLLCAFVVAVLPCVSFLLFIYLFPLFEVWAFYVLRIQVPTFVQGIGIWGFKYRPFLSVLEFGDSSTDFCIVYLRLFLFPSFTTFDTMFTISSI